MLLTMQSVADITPEKRELNSLQRAHLGELAGIAPAAMDRLTVEEIRVKFGWQIDPRLLLFRRLTGRVTTQGADGVYRPAANVIVRVDNTLCDLLHDNAERHGEMPALSWMKRTEWS